MPKYSTGSSAPTIKTDELLVDPGNLLRDIARNFGIH